MAIALTAAIVELVEIAYISGVFVTSGRSGCVEWVVVWRRIRIALKVVPAKRAFQL